MSVKIAVLADLHYRDSDEREHPARRTDVADVLLLRSVHRLNRLVKPDVTLFAGDLRDDEDSPGAVHELERLRVILDHLESPLLAIPGNHDCATETFYRVLDEPPEWLDVRGVRFLCFVDPEAPGFNATRPHSAIERMAGARSGFDGPIVTLQHVPLFPPGACDVAYNYTNAAEIIEAMRRYGVRLTVSGHYHAGIDLIETEGARFLAAPAMCESPFRFLEIDLDGERVEVRTQALAIPEELGLLDRHVHTPLAYCNENMDVAKALALGRDLGLAAVALSEHSDQMYFTEVGTYNWEVMAGGVDLVQAGALAVAGADGEAGAGQAAPDGERAVAAFFAEQGLAPPFRGSDPFDQRMIRRRMDAYFELALEGGCPPERIGLELDCDFQGRPVVLDEDRARCGFLTGAVHQLPEKQRPEPDLGRMCDEFLALHQRFLASGIATLAHPFRVFRRAGLEAPEALYEPFVRLLKENGVAAEINFHTNDPPPAFFRLCIDAGVPLAFGSDAHNLYEIGDFALHLDLLARCGYDGDPRDVLLGEDWRLPVKAV